MYKASWVSLNTHLTVAIKILKSGATQEEKKHFLMEALVMGQFSHPNVVQLCGVVSRANPVMLIMEYLENGSLDRYLKVSKERVRGRNFTETERVGGGGDWQMHKERRIDCCQKVIIRGGEDLAMKREGEK